MLSALAKMSPAPTSDTPSDAALLPLIYNELQELKRKNVELESKLDSLTVESSAPALATPPVGSPSSSLRRQSAGGLTPIDMSKPTKVPSVPSIPSSSGSTLGISPLTGKIVPKDGTGLHVNQTTLDRIQEVETFYADNRVILTTYPNQMGIDPYPLNFGHPDPKVRGPIVASRHPKSIKRRNAIGAYSGSYMVYKALAVATGQLGVNHLPDFTNTEPAFEIPAQPEWGDPFKICTLDPFGHIPQILFKTQIEAGLDVRPTMAATKAFIKMRELDDAVSLGRLNVDGEFVVTSERLPGMDSSQDPGVEAASSKIAVEPVWFLPGIAQRLGISEGLLRRALFEETGGMFPELMTRHDLQVFLPPIAGATIYIFGPPEYLSDPTKEVTVRVHDECNSSDVHGSSICTCRPYMTYGIEEAIRCAQRGGVGLLVYLRKEGRALGETIKFMVYNARKRGKDTADAYFMRTERVAGLEDSRFQPLMSDILVWLGIRRIDNMISMSDMKAAAIRAAGIEIVNRYEIPENLLPPDAQVEISAKINAGYYSSKKVTDEDLRGVVGQAWENIHQ